MGAGSAGVMDNAEPAWAFPALVAMGCRQADINSRRGEGRYHGLKKGCRAAIGQPLPSVSQPRSEEHTSELLSLMRISYAVFCLKKKTTKYHYYHTKTHATSITHQTPTSTP